MPSVRSDERKVPSVSAASTLIHITVVSEARYFPILSRRPNFSKVHNNNYDGSRTINRDHVSQAHL